MSLSIIPTPARQASPVPALGVALALHAAVVAAAFLVPPAWVDSLLRGNAPESPLEAGALEQDVILAAPPDEAPPLPSPVPDEAPPALADAAPAPAAEPPPPPEPQPEFVQPAPPPSPALAAADAEPVARALSIPAPAAVPEPASDPAPRVVIGNDGFPKPSYPYEARARRQEGTVVLALDVVAGAVVAATVVGSSGYATLDRAAVQCVRNRWRFPATVTASVTQPIQFALE